MNEEHKLGAGCFVLWIVMLLIVGMVCLGVLIAIILAIFD